MFRISLFVAAASFALALPAHAARPSARPEAFSAAEEFDPFAADAEQTLESFDRAVEADTGSLPWLQDLFTAGSMGCRRESCAVWALVDRRSQTLRLYVNGEVAGGWKVSTGVPGRDTPNFDKHPDGRVYQAYTSTKFPGGNYKGLGNMPYAVFISGGFALHGTPTGNWRALGRRASHGCIRQNPANAQIFNSLVRQYGVRNTWVTVQ